MNTADLFWEIEYPDGTGFATTAQSLFEAAAEALHWCEVESRSFGTDRVFADDDVLHILLDRSKCSAVSVKVRQVREWIRQRATISRPASE